MKLRYPTALGGFDETTLRENATNKDPSAMHELIQRSSYFESEAVAISDEIAIELSRGLTKNAFSPRITKNKLQEYAVTAYYVIGMTFLRYKFYKESQKPLQAAALAAKPTGNTRDIAAEAAFELFTLYQKTDRNPPYKMVSINGLIWLVRALLLESPKAIEALKNNELIPELDLPLNSRNRPYYQNQLKSVINFITFIFLENRDPIARNSIHEVPKATSLAQQAINEFIYVEKEVNIKKSLDIKKNKLLGIIASNPKTNISLLIDCHRYGILTDDFCLPLFEAAVKDDRNGDTMKNAIHYHLFKHYLITKNEDLALKNLSKLKNFFGDYQIHFLNKQISYFNEPQKSRIQSLFCSTLTAHLEFVLDQCKKNNSLDFFVTQYQLAEKPIENKYSLVSEFIFTHKLNNVQKMLIEQYTLIYNALLKVNYTLPGVASHSAHNFIETLQHLSKVAPIIPTDEIVKAQKKLLAKLPKPQPGVEAAETSDQNADFFDLVESTVKLLCTDYLNEREQRQKNSRFVLFSHGLDQLLNGRTDWIYANLNTIKQQWAEVHTKPEPDKIQLVTAFKADLALLSQCFTASKSPTLHALIQHQMKKLESICPIDAAPKPIAKPS